MLDINNPMLSVSGCSPAVSWGEWWWSSLYLNVRVTSGILVVTVVCFQIISVSLFSSGRVRVQSTQTFQPLFQQEDDVNPDYAVSVFCRSKKQQQQQQEPLQKLRYQFSVQQIHADKMNKQKTTRTEQNPFPLQTAVRHYLLHSDVTLWHQSCCLLRMK